MSEIPPIGLPNLVSQGNLVARAWAANAGAERAANDTIALELRRIAEERAEQVQRAERVGGTSRQRRDRSNDEQDPHSRYDHGDDADDEDDGEHVLDVTA
jgi:hypothetical protein